MNCYSYVEVYYPSEKTIKEYEKNKGETHERF